jgi:hypothetical protein
MKCHAKGLSTLRLDKPQAHASIGAEANRPNLQILAALAFEKKHKR